MIAILYVSHILNLIRNCQIVFQSCTILHYHQQSQMVKNLPEMQEKSVQFLSKEDPLKEEMTTQSSILAWKIPWTEEPSGLLLHGVSKSRTVD